MSKLKVVVTENHIFAGLPEDSESCPIALALNELLPDLIIIIGNNNMTIDLTEEIDLPDAAADFVKAFDTGKPVEPFEFELELPDWLYYDES